MILTLCLPSGTQIYCLNGTDPEGHAVSYGLAFDPGTKEYFRVNPKTGNVTLIEPLDREVISHFYMWFFDEYCLYLCPNFYRDKTLFMSLSVSMMGRARYLFLRIFLVQF